MSDAPLYVSDIVHLHVHSEYSMLDGAISVAKLVAKAKQFGHSHVALTDHANLHGALEFYLEAKKAGIIPIIGCEIYCEAVDEASESLLPEGNERRCFHLVLLAKNYDGYRSLLKLVSSGYLGEGFRDIPIVSRASLREHAKDLIALSACQRGELGALVSHLRQSQAHVENLLLDPEDVTVKAIALHIARMQEIYGKDNYYAEMIDNNLPGQKAFLKDLAEVAQHFKVPLVATGDVHYLDDAFAETHHLAIAIKNSLTLNDIGQRLLNTRFDFANDEKMRETFADWPEAISNIAKIARECSYLAIPMGKYYLPKIDLGGLSPKQALLDLARKGLEHRFEAISIYYGDRFTEEKKGEYLKRLEYELDVIGNMGFADYFLIVSDFIKWAKTQKIPVGPGRGSGAGSLVAYALEITDLDPIPYTLIFERFLNPERISMPDFDVDFCQWRREEVIAYCVNKYGIKNVAQITTFGRMQAKAAVKSVGRAMNFGYSVMDQFTKLFPNDLNITLKDALEKEPRLQQALDRDESLKNCFDKALRLEGMISHASVHAAGIVISDGDMTNYLPVYTTDGQNLITQYEMKPTEKVGLVKFDFLGLKTLTVIDKAVNFVRERLNPDLDITKIPLDDDRVYQMLSKGYTCGIFQCESSGITNLIKKLKPSTFEDIIALVALFRPGPLGSGMVDDFVLRKHGKQAITYQHPDLAPILSDTYGMIVYQEQVQKIAAVLANYSLGEADLLRRAMGKKIPEEMAQQKDRFLAGAKARDIDPRLAEEIFDLMAEFAKYGFNKSHSAAYGLVTYQTAYLKTHYPEEFLAASMTCDLDNTEKVVRYAQDAWRMGFVILPPDINRSQIYFDVPKSGHIGFALTAIKGVGENSVKLLIDEREANGEFTSLTQMAHRVNLNKVGKKTLQLLCAAGALDRYTSDRSKLDALIADLVEYSLEHHKAKSSGQRSLFSMDEESEASAKKDEAGPWDGLKDSQKQSSWQWSDLFIEKKLLGIFLTAHPLDCYQQDIKAFASTRIRDLDHAVDNVPFDNRGRKVKPVTFVALYSGAEYRRTKSNNLMAYITLEDKEIAIEGQMFSSQLEKTTLPEVDSVVLVFANAEQGKDDSQVRLVIERLLPLDELRATRVAGLRFEIQADSYDENESLGLTQKLLDLCGNEDGHRVPFQVRLKYQKTSVDLNFAERQIAISDRFVRQMAALAGVSVSYVLKREQG